jgi:hypothetical protein
MRLPPMWSSISISLESQRAPELLGSEESFAVHGDFHPSPPPDTEWKFSRVGYSRTIASKKQDERYSSSSRESSSSVSAGIRTSPSKRAPTTRSASSSPARCRRRYGSGGAISSTRLSRTTARAGCKSEQRCRLNPLPITLRPPTEVLPSSKAGAADIDGLRRH